MPRYCPTCGNELPPGKQVTAFPKLASSLIVTLYSSPSVKTTFLAQHYALPVRLVSRIRKCRSLHEAQQEFGA